MYDAFLYIVANDGVDTSSAYSYRGQVRGVPIHYADQRTMFASYLLLSVYT
jgi:hypothetical protein